MVGWPAPAPSRLSPPRHSLPCVAPAALSSALPLSAPSGSRAGVTCTGVKQERWGSVAPQGMIGRPESCSTGVRTTIAQRTAGAAARRLTAQGSPNTGSGADEHAAFGWNVWSRVPDGDDRQSRSRVSASRHGTGAWPHAFAVGRSRRSSARTWVTTRKRSLEPADLKTRLSLQAGRTPRRSGLADRIGACRRARSRVWRISGLRSGTP